MKLWTLQIDASCLRQKNEKDAFLSTDNFTKYYEMPKLLFVYASFFIFHFCMMPVGTNFYFDIIHMSMYFV